MALPTPRLPPPVPVPRWLVRMRRRLRRFSMSFALLILVRLLLRPFFGLLELDEAACVEDAAAAGMVLAGGALSSLSPLLW